MDKKKLFARISSICLGVDLAALIVSRVMLFFQENYTIMYITAMVYTYALYALAPIAIAWAVLNWKFVKEFVRKMIVSLKRKPSMIPLLMLFVSFLYYSLNLTAVSNTTALIQGKGMGLCQFCIMLINMLAMLCMLNAFPRRKKTNIPMLVLVYAMMGVLLFCDYHYMNGIAAALNRAESPIKLSAENAYVAKAFNMLSTYQVMIIVTAVLTATLPIYSKLIRKIKTSVQVEDNGAMAEIEIGE